MIKELRFDKHDAPFAYVKNLAFFKDKRKVSFKPGLNILIGPNGSGKSTIIMMLARYLAAAQGGVSVVTESWVRDNYNMFDKKKLLRYSVVHDGQPILYGNPRQTIGLSGGAFDDDFFSQGLSNIMRRGSTGETTLSRLNSTFAVLANKAKFPTEIHYTMEKSKVNDTWENAITALEENFVAKIKKGSPTVLLDEPESGLSIAMQLRLWSKLLAVPSVAKQYQLIVATHSPFALNVPHANYIELEPEYVASSTKAIDEWKRL